MSKKKSIPQTGGHASLKRRGLRVVTVPLSPTVHLALARAAAAQTPRVPVTQFAASALEAAARAALLAACTPWPKEE